jgi:hypothetical protein
MELVIKDIKTSIINIPKDIKKNVNTMIRELEDI